MNKEHLQSLMKKHKDELRRQALVQFKEHIPKWEAQMEKAARAGNRQVSIGTDELVTSDDLLLISALYEGVSVRLHILSYPVCIRQLIFDWSE